jgi:hypothetical protein
MALNDSEFQHLLHKFFGQEKAAKFPTALVKAMREFSDESFTNGMSSRSGAQDQAYDQGFSEGWDSGAHQAYVECNPDSLVEEGKAHQFMASLRTRHRESWKAIAKADYANCNGQIFRKKDGRFAWRVVNGDGRVMAISEQTFSTELGAKIEAKQVTGMPFL